MTYKIEDCMTAPLLRSTPHPRRWLICGLLFAATTINYLDRQVLSLLAPDLQRNLGWTEEDYGNIVTAFQAAYALALVGVGQVIDRIGVRLGYALSVGLWSLASIGHAAVSSVVGFGCMRAVLGVFEAGNFPAAIKTVAEWFPRQERALANGLFNTGSIAGAILAPLSVPWLAHQFGWQATFIIMGGLGFAWIVAWWMCYGKLPITPSVDPAEEVPSDDGETIPVSSLLTRRSTWALIVARLCSDPIWWFFLFWLAKFLDSRYGLKLTDMSLPLVTIYGIAAIGSIGGGWLPRRWMAHGVDMRTARLRALLICALAVLPVFLAVREVGLWTAVVLIGVAMAAHCAWISNVFALISDLFPRRSVGTVAGISGMAGSVGGMIMSYGAGKILAHTGSYVILFSIAAISYLCGWFIICLLIPKSPDQKRTTSWI